MLRLFRVAEADELKGLDIIKHNEPAYPKGSNKGNLIIKLATQLRKLHVIMNCIFIEIFYLNSTLNSGIPPVLIFQLENYYKVDRLLTGPTAQQKGTTAQWYSKYHLSQDRVAEAR